MKTQDSVSTMEQVASSLLLLPSRIPSSDTLHDDLTAVEVGDMTALSVRDLNRATGMSLRPSNSNLNRIVSGGSMRTNSQEADDEPHLQGNLNTRYVVHFYDDFF